MNEAIPGYCAVVTQLTGHKCGIETRRTTRAKVGNMEVLVPICTKHIRRLSEHNRSHAAERVTAPNLTATQRV